MRRRFAPSVMTLELRAMLDGSDDGYALAYAPPPEVQPAPPGGILGGPDLTSGGDGIGYDPTRPAGGDFAPPPPEGDPNLDGYTPIGGGPVYSPPFSAFD